MADMRPTAAFPDDASLERALRDLGTAIEEPARTRDLAAAVGERIRRETVRSAAGFALGADRRPRVRVALLLAAALVVLLAAVVAAAIIGLPGIRFVFVEGPVSTPSAVPSPSAVASPSAVPSPSAVASPSAVPSPSAVASPSPSASGPIGSALGLGEPVDPSRLDALVGRHVPVPGALGRPTAAFVDTRFGASVVSLVWGASPTLPDAAADGTTEPTGIGAILTSIPASINAPYLEKVIGEGGTVERVTVAGAPGFWVSGAPHELVLLDPNGNGLPSLTRLAGSSLLWQQGGATLRFESALGRARAIDVGASVR
jgi:hypothetical protein